MCGVSNGITSINKASDNFISNF